MTHTPKKITEMYAWVCEEPDGGEGVPAVDLGTGLPMPLVGADRERIESLRRHAINGVLPMGYPVKLVRFHEMEVLERHEPTVKISRS